MSTSTSAPGAATHKASGAPVAALDPSIPAAHRAVLQRIAAQRERLKGRRVARAQALALRSSQASRMPSGGGLPDRLLAFARLHPVALAALVGGAAVLGPMRLIRWTGIVLPLLAKLKR